METTENKFEERKKTIKRCWNPVKRYIANSSIHGIPFLVEDGRHWTEIIFWLVACALSWYGCISTVSDTIEDFQTRKTAITMDTNYLKWETSFPALHFCFGFTNRAKEYLLGIKATEPKKSGALTRLNQWIKLGYVDAIKYPISTEEFMNYRETLMPQCDDLFGVCKWNDEEINCCNLFFPLQSNLGGCFSFNSVHAGRPTDPDLPKFVINQQSRIAKLTIFLNMTNFWIASRSNINALITDPLEFPTQLSGRESFLTAQWNNPKPRVWDITQIPTYNDDGVLSAEIKDRRCRLSKEIQGLFHIKHYNLQGCILEAQMVESDKLCNCISHMFPTNDKYRICNQTELKCVGDNREAISNAKSDECLEDCEQTQIVVFENIVDDSDIPPWAVTKLEFNILPGPTRQYHRYTVVSLLDVVVTVGGTLGLFVGASVLSLVEIPYWLFLRRDDDDDNDDDDN